MKFHLPLLTAALFSTTALNAADILIYKGTYTEKDSSVAETNYETPTPISTGSTTITTTYRYYLIMDLTNQTVFRVDYQSKPAKTFVILDADLAVAGPTAADLSAIFQTIPLKPVGTAKKNLWSTTRDLQNNGDVGFRESAADSPDDTDTALDMELSATSAYVTGTGSPFTLTKSPLTVIQGVPTKLSGPTNSVFAQRLSGGPKEQLYNVYAGKNSLTLDSKLTKDANLKPVTPTVIVGFGPIGTPIPAATMSNGVQQVANALKKLKFNPAL